MIYRRGIVAGSALMMSALALAGCASSSPASSPTVPLSSATTWSAPTANTPRAVAATMIDAIQHTDIGRFCAVVVPSRQQQCNSAELSNAFATASATNVAFHQTVISGDRALVSITGRICLAGRCTVAKDPNSGMPSAKVTFKQAWRFTLSPTGATAAGAPFQRVNGQWYAVFS